MRPQVNALNVDAMIWQPLGPPGLFSKLLSQDDETGARTALQWLSPSQKYEPPTVAHYHHTYEEILGIKGLFSFDSRRWIRPTSYVFHPPGTVHGFKSAVIEESWFLSRVGRKLDVNLVPQPTHDDIYPLDGTPAERRAVAYGNPETEKGYVSARWGDSPTDMSWCALSSHPKTGEGSALMQVPAGWSTAFAAPVTQSYFEAFVLAGDLALDGAAHGEHFYSYFPAGHAPTRIRSDAGATVYVNFGEPVDVRERK